MKNKMRMAIALLFNLVLCLCFNLSASASSGEFSIPENTMLIEEMAFADCQAMKSITIPTNVTRIGKDAFAGCVNLTDVYYSGHKTQWLDITIEGGNESLLNSKIHFIADAVPLASGVWGDLTWKLDENGLLSISGEGPIDSFYDTPSDEWLSYRDYITCTVIDNGITDIGAGAFTGCSKMNTITLPDTLTTIGYCAFLDCSQLREVVFPDSLKSIGLHSFTNCTNLRNITFSKNLSYIGGFAFSGCVLKAVELPSSLTLLASGAFSGCTSLNEITVSPDNITYCDVDGVLFDKDMNSIIQYPCGRAGAYAIPQGVTTVDDYAFSTCGNLTSLTIPESVALLWSYTFIGGEKYRSPSFFGCNNLNEIIVDPNNASCCDVSGVLFSKDMTRLVSYPAGRTGAYTIPQGVKILGSESFRGCENLTNVIIPESVINIESHAFLDCSNLTSVTIPGSITRIDASAFSGCNSLADVYFDGTLEQWQTVWSGTPGNSVSNATIHFLRNDSDIQSYAFYVNAPLNGSFYLRVNGVPVTRGVKGAPVSIIAMPDDGYELKQVKVTKHGSNDQVYVSSFGDIIFTMPEAAVDIEVTFGKKRNNILIMPNQIANVYAFEESSVPESVTLPHALEAAVIDAYSDSRIYLVAVNLDDPDNPYDISENNYTIDYTVVRNSDGTTIEIEKDASIGLKNVRYFTMPDCGVTVTPIIKKKAGVNLCGEIYYNNDGPKNIYSGYSFSVICQNRVIEYTGVEDRVERFPSLEYADLREDTVQGVAFTRYDILVSGSRDDAELSASLTRTANLHGYFLIPTAESITIRAFFEGVNCAINPAAITGSGIVNYQNAAGDSITSCIPGETVTLLLEPSDGYIFNDSRYDSKLTVHRTDNGATVPVNKINMKTYSFTMPEGGVDIRATFDVKSYGITMKCLDELGNNLGGPELMQVYVNGAVCDTGDDSGNGEKTFDVDYGDYVIVAMTEEAWSNYDLVSFCIDGQEYISNFLNYFYSFQMIETCAKNIEIISIFRLRAINRLNL